jgi:hypothetical protein
MSDQGCANNNDPKPTRFDLAWKAAKWQLYLLSLRLFYQHFSRTIHYFGMHRMRLRHPMGGDEFYRCDWCGMYGTKVEVKNHLSDNSVDNAVTKENKMSGNQACENTDIEIWRGPDEGGGDFYADSLFITKKGALGINCGGSVYVKPIREWHRLAGGPISIPKPNAAETKAAQDFIVGKSEEMVEFAGMPGATVTKQTCNKCGRATGGEEAWVDGKIWCHPCADGVPASAFSNGERI